MTPSFQQDKTSRASELRRNQSSSPVTMEKPPVPLIISTVTYCCGACGYDLKLSSLARDTTRRRGRSSGVVVFEAIDDARFGHLDEFRCLDVRALRLFSRRTRLLCRKCGAQLGYGYHDTAAATKPPRFHIKIRALHPASDPSSPKDPSAASAADA